MKTGLFKILTLSIISLIPLVGCSQEKKESSSEQKLNLWQVDYDKAMEQAKKEDKVVFLYFTGSDWCIWCQKLDSLLLSKKEFLDYAKDKMVLIKCDFGQGGPVAKEFAKKHIELMQKFQVEGFPTFFLINPANNKSQMGGYADNLTPKNFIKIVEEFKAKK